ncbi:hypothetical protein [Senegalia sp. (in: firmicutes)]|uniref:hypothetical protein n=1 Tax=Senegalia sp. (in: firmicutes) TaxID=1924098 RepID=UPI003F946ED9
MINIEEKENVKFKCISTKKDIRGKNLIDEINSFNETLKKQNIINEYKIFTVINSIKLIGFDQIMKAEILAIFDRGTDDIRFEPVDNYKVSNKNFDKILFAEYKGNPHGIQMFHQRIQKEIEKKKYNLISPPYNIFNDPNNFTNGNNKEFNIEMFFEIE